MSHFHAGTILRLTWIFTFGKHKGKTIEEVARDYPDYVIWLVNDAELAYLSFPVSESLSIIMSGYPLTHRSGNGSRVELYRATFEDVKKYQDKLFTKQVK